MLRFGERRCYASDLGTRWILLEKLWQVKLVEVLDSAVSLWWNVDGLIQDHS